jgi:hypothetical protein
MKIDFNHLEHLINLSKYGSMNKFFKSGDVAMNSPNYYKLRRGTGELLGHHVTEICTVLGISPEEIVITDLNSISVYRRENELLKMLVREKDARIEYLQNALDKKDELDKNNNE